MAWPVVGPPSLRGALVAGLLLLGIGAGLTLRRTTCPSIIVDVKVGAPMDPEVVPQVDDAPIVVDIGDETPILFECRFQGRYLACR
jgi:hypothetical protein